MKVDDGFETHLFSYRHDGAEWVIPIQARDADDARRRVGNLAYATYDGVLIAKVPAAIGPLAKLAVRIKNAAHALGIRF